MHAAHLPGMKKGVFEVVYDSVRDTVRSFTARLVISVNGRLTLQRTSYDKRRAARSDESTACRTTSDAARTRRIVFSAATVSG